MSQQYPFPLLDDHFATLVRARNAAWDLMEELASEIRTKNIRTEKEAHAIYKTLVIKYGVEKAWHAPKIRFGKNTLLGFSAESDASVSLQDDDVFFVDLGPVFENFEADVGRPYFVGKNPEHQKLIEACEKVFHEVKQHWEENKVSGQALYDFAEAAAQKHGFELLRKKAGGHIVSDFPHRIKFRDKKAPGALENYTENILPYLWILEIQIKHPTLDIGAFYEDLLIDPQAKQ